ncbi:hypothetical protein L6241_13445 [Janibacter sp. Y6]|uniref:hypothetical protein n=1 Tax=Janibacter sp. Y6 TaxID=2913552 RepID=UPI0034A20C8A
MLQESLSTTELVVWGLVILALAVVILVAFVLVERPPRRGQVRVRRRPEGDVRDPRGRWDQAERVDRERDRTRR